MCDFKRIEVLPDSVVNKIAAGEIIERPVAVVKELVENSLDAGASKIDVKFDRGGKFFIGVDDDGCGMSCDDALVALRRHATSKLRDIGDLNSLHTFGFRGEALPSIASVCRFKIITCRREDTFGTSIAVEGGKLLDAKDCAKFCGTRIVVENLFYNVPARRKFLKSDETEAAHIASLVKNLALSESGVKFSMFQNGTKIFSSPTSGNIGHRVNEIFKHGEKFIDFSHARGDFEIKGTICDPTFGNVCRKNIELFINGRLVKNDLVVATLCEELAGVFPAHRGILAYIFLKIDPAAVDVNVHPTKSEVRFRQEMPVREFIKNCAAAIFEKKYSAASAEISADAAQMPAAKQSFPNSTGSVSAVERSFRRELSPVPSPRAEMVGMRKILSMQQKMFDFAAESTKNSGEWNFIGTVFGEIALFESETGIVIFNVRLAASRVIYERILAECDPCNSQRLVFPIEISLSQEEMECLQRFSEVLVKHGFSIYAFGKCDHKVDAIPTWLSHKDAEIIIRELVAGRTVFSKNLSDACLEETFARCASKLVHPSDYCERGAVEKLRDGLLSCKNPLLCPHGNATYFEIPLADISRRFSPNGK
jgi:DNA mismatch repair protein MutL